MNGKPHRHDGAVTDAERIEQLKAGLAEADDCGQHGIETGCEECRTCLKAAVAAAEAREKALGMEITMGKNNTPHKEKVRFEVHCIYGLRSSWRSQAGAVRTAKKSSQRPGYGPWRVYRVAKKKVWP